MTTIYKKQGRRYVEIGRYENESLYYPHGASLVFARPGGSLTRYNIEPAHAGLLAAAEPMRDAMVEAMRKASEMKLATHAGKPITAKQRKAWEAYKAIAGEQSSLQLQGASIQDIVDAGIKVLIEAAIGGKND